MNNLKSKVMSGLFWTFGERIIAQLVSFIISVVLARILMPKEYGIISMVLVFINIANVFVSNGLGEALVQKKDSDETDFSTMFFCSLVLAGILYVVLFFCAPVIARFYKVPQLVAVLRVFAVKIPISSVSTIQHAYVSKHMIFKKFFFSTLGGTIISGIIGIVMALNGFGVWALVFQYLTNTLIDTIVLFITVPWRPHFMFSLKSAKSLLSFGWKLMAANFINTLYNEIRSLVIGRIYTSSDLAFYNKGNQFPSLIITNIDTAIGKVVFPAMVYENDNKDRLKAASRKAIKTTTYIIFPLLVGMSSVGRTLIILLLGKKWLPAVPFLMISCVYWLSQPLQTTNWQIIKAVGRSDLCFKLEIIKKIIGFILVFASMKISVNAIAVSAAVYGFISMFINMLPNKKLINYSITEMIKDILPSAVISLCMGIIVYFIGMIPMNIYIVFVLQIFTGALFYVGLSFIFKLDSFTFLFNSVKNTIKK